MTDLLTIILAAGEGTRMRSAIPKVLHPIGGLPMVGHVIRAAQTAGATAISVVVGPGHEKIEAVVAAAAPGAQIGLQQQRLGTGHAVRQAREAFAMAKGNVVVLYGDGPMLKPATIRDVAMIVNESPRRRTFATPSGIGVRTRLTSLTGSRR